MLLKKGMFSPDMFGSKEGHVLHRMCSLLKEFMCSPDLFASK